MDRHGSSIFSCVVWSYKDWVDAFNACCKSAGLEYWLVFGWLGKYTFWCRDEWKLCFGHSVEWLWVQILRLVKCMESLNSVYDHSAGSISFWARADSAFSDANPLCSVLVLNKPSHFYSVSTSCSSFYCRSSTLNNSPPTPCSFLVQSCCLKCGGKTKTKRVGAVVAAH